MLLVDASASHALRHACGSSRASWPPSSRALLAFSAISNNDKVGLVIFTDRVELAVPPRRARATCCASSARSCRCAPPGAAPTSRRRSSTSSGSRKRRCGRLRGLRLPRSALPPGAADRDAPARRDRRRARRSARGDAARTSAWSSSRTRRRGDALVVDTGERARARGVRGARRGRARRARPHAARRRRRRDRRRAPIGPTPKRCCASSACGSGGSEPRGALAAARGRCSPRAAWRRRGRAGGAGHRARTRRSRRADDRPALPLRRWRWRRRRASRSS